MKEELLARLDVLAEKLGVAAGHLWEVLVRQAILHGYVDLGSGLLVLSIAIPAMVWCWRKAAESPDDVGFFRGLTAVVGGAACAVAFYDGIRYGLLELLNPEYYALKEILQALGG